MRLTLCGLAGAAAASLALSGCAGAVLTHDASAKVAAVQVGPPAARASAANDTTDANRELAQRDAAALLKKLRLPSGVSRVLMEPAGDSGYLKVSRGFDGDSAHAMAYAWWTIKERPVQLLSYLKAHAPYGSYQSGTGSISDDNSGAAATIITFQWPSSGDRLASRQLQVTVAALADGKTGIFAESESDWIVVRAPSEKVPASATTVTVTMQGAPKGIGTKRLTPTIRRVLTGKRAVARAITLVDALRVVQPVVIACPLFALQAGSLTVTYSAGPAGPVLAQAKVELFPDGQAGGAGECDPIAFTIRGRTEQALIGASFAARIEQLAGFER